MFYRWSTCSERCAEYMGATDQDERATCWYDEVLGDPLPAISDWRTPTLVQYLGEHGKRKPKPIGDNPIGGLELFVSQRAVDALGDVLTDEVWLYPVHLTDDPDQPYYMVVARHVLDCLDRERSQGMMISGPKANGQFAVVNRWVFRDDAGVEARDVFAAVDQKLELYVSERFVQRVLDAKLEGFLFERVEGDPKPIKSPAPKRRPTVEEPVMPSTTPEPISVEAWCKQLQDIVKAQDWSALSALRVTTNEALAAGGEPKRLREHYLQALAQALPAARVEQMPAMDTVAFETALTKSLAVAEQRLSSLPGIKALYFEYYFDGDPDDDSNSGNLFLCEAYSESDDSWAAEFDEDGFVAGARLPAFFFYDDESWSDYEQMLAGEAVNGVLMAAVLKVWRSSPLSSRLPLGYANHDHEMVRVR